MRAEYGVRVSCVPTAPLPDSALFGELAQIYARINIEVHAYMRVSLRAVSVYFCTILKNSLNRSSCSHFVKPAQCFSNCWIQTDRGRKIRGRSSEMQKLVNQYLCPYKDINRQFHCPNLDLAATMSTLATVSCEIWDFQAALPKMKLSGIGNHFDSNNNNNNNNNVKNKR